MELVRESGQVMLACFVSWKSNLNMTLFLGDDTEQGNTSGKAESKSKNLTLKLDW